MWWVADVDAATRRKRRARAVLGALAGGAILVVVLWQLTVLRPTGTYEGELTTQGWGTPCGTYDLTVPGAPPRSWVVARWGSLDGRSLPDPPVEGPVTVERWSAPLRDTEWRVEVPGRGAVALPNGFTSVGCDIGA